MKKFCSLLSSILFTVMFFSGSSGRVMAEVVYGCTSYTAISSKTDLSSDFSQILTLKNLSSQYVIHYFDLFLPFTAINVNASISGNSVIVQNNQGHIQLDLENHFIGPQKEVRIDLSFVATDLVRQNGSFKSFFLPQLDYCDQGDSKITYNYPVDWGAPSYISTSEVFEQDGTYTMNSNNELYLVFGKNSPVKISANWELKSGKIIPIPSSNFNKFDFISSPESARVFKDVYGNEYLEMEYNYDYISSFSGLLTPLSEVKLLDHGNKYPDTTSILNINTNQSVKQIHQAILERFEPELVQKFSNPGSLTDIVSKKEQNAFDYAYTLATMLEAKGLKTNIFYGLAKLPVNEEYIWHFWVGYEEQDKILLVDPFFDDLFHFNSFGTITPDRVIWGIYTRENDFILDSLSNFTDLQGIISSLAATPDQPQVLGDRFATSVKMIIKNDLTRELGVMLTNMGNNVVYIDELIINGQINATAPFQHLGILPEQSKYLDLREFISPRYVFDNNGSLQASLKLSSAGRSYDLTTNTITLQSFWLYLTFFVLIFVFFIIFIHIVRTNFYKFRRPKIDTAP